MIPTTEFEKPIIKTDLPGPKGREIIEADAKYVTPSYPRPDYKLVAHKGYGPWLEDPDGNVFLDCNAGVAVCSTGHAAVSRGVFTSTVCVCPAWWHTRRSSLAAPGRS